MGPKSRTQFSKNFAFLDKYPRLVGLALTVIIAIHHGWSVFPNAVWIMQVVQSFPRLPHLDSLAQYNLFSIGPYLAMHFVAISDPQILVTISFIGTAVLTCAMYQISNKKQDQNLVFTVFITSPVFLILLSWVGSYDLVTVTCVVIVMYSKRTSLALLAGVVVAWSNFEQFVFCILLLSLAFDSKQNLRRKRYLVSLAASFISYFSIRAFLLNKGVRMTRLSGLIEWLSDPSYFSKTLSALPFTIFSIFASAFILALYWNKFCQPDLLSKVRLVTAGCVVLSLSLISLDQTRIGAIHILPLCFVLSERIAVFAPPNSVRKIRALLIATTLVFPPFFVWSSTIHRAGWGNLLLRI